MGSRAVLVLADGTFFEGTGFGASEKEVEGEVVFSTSMTGYTELLTDPSFSQQILTLTCPEIGNCGVTLSDRESDRIHAAALVVRELSPVVSNWRAEISLDDWLKHEGVPGLCGVDTRALVHHLRANGSMMAILSTCQEADIVALHARAKKLEGMEGRDLVSEVTTQGSYVFQNGLTNLDGSDVMSHTNEPFHVVVVDFGVKRNMLRLLVHHGCRVTVVPANVSATDVLDRLPDGVLLSNGPGDPATMTGPIHLVQNLIGKIPIFGICMGHQILSLAAGAKTYKLKFGHRGANQPVMGQDRKVQITSQNHGFAVDDQDQIEGLIQTQINVSDATVEGVELLDQWAFGVQYHPEGAPGPHDAQGYFARFIDLMRMWKKTQAGGVF